MAHTSETLCYCAEVYVVHNGKVLLRMHDKHGIWLSVGGHIEPGEDPNEAALREVKEEVGLDVELAGECGPRISGEPDVVPPRYFVRHAVDEKREHLVFIYFARSETEKLIIPAHEDAECRWFTMEELDDPRFGLKEKVRYFARAALEELR